MDLFLGMDGGGTGCRAALTDAHGQILARAEGGGANIHSQPETAVANILSLIAQVTQGIVAPDSPNLRAVLGLAGANVPQATARLSAALPLRRFRIVSDAMTATTGALQGADGLVAAMGTGSVFAVLQGGAYRQFGGRGFVLGDEGGGAVLGRQLLSEALLAADGFAPLSPLLADVLQDLGGPEGVITFAATAQPADFARYAPRIVAGPDPAAQRLWAQALDQIGQRIDALQPDPALNVVFLGGLGPAYAAGLAGRWPIRPALGSSLDGALLLARTLP